MKALILVDLQNDFLPGGALAVNDGDAVVPVANRLQKAFDLVVATQDWHPPEHGCFAANHPGAEAGQRIQLHGLEQILWPVHCVQGSFGAELAPGFETRSIDRIFTKGTHPKVDSYSAFFDNGRSAGQFPFRGLARASGGSTGLGDYLRQLGVEEIYIAGLATDYCVKYTALDAAELGFETYLVQDGCRAVNLRPGDEQRAIAEMSRAGVQMVHSYDLVVPPIYRPEQILVASA
jgi:nicotinamidase/pyrazinamidase